MHVHHHLDESIEWLEWIAMTHSVWVQHRGNYGEKTIWVPCEPSTSSRTCNHHASSPKHYWRTNVNSSTRREMRLQHQRTHSTNDDNESALSPSSSLSEEDTESESQGSTNSSTEEAKYKRYVVDGFYDQSAQWLLATCRGQTDVSQKVVLEYFGCLVHSCPVHYQTEPDSLNPVTKKSHHQTLKDTLDRLKHIQTKYHVDYIWSCQWQEMK